MRFKFLGKRRGNQAIPQASPASGPEMQGSLQRVPRIVTSGFDDSEAQEFHLHYTERAQPDRGGGLNYSYDAFALPIEEVGGPGIIPPMQWMITQPQPPQFFQAAPETAPGGTWAGQFVQQPLLDPNAPGTGFDPAGEFVLPEDTMYTGTTLPFAGPG